MNVDLKLYLTQEQFVAICEEADRLNMTVQDYIKFKCGVDFE